MVWFAWLSCVQVSDFGIYIYRIGYIWSSRNSFTWWLSITCMNLKRS